MHGLDVPEVEYMDYKCSRGTRSEYVHGTRIGLKVLKVDLKLIRATYSAGR